MKVGDRIRMALRTFLRIEPAQAQSFQVQETLSREGQSIAFRLWYHGDGEELNEFYTQLNDHTQRFWGSVPTAGREIRKIHTGLPKEIIDTLSNMIVADLNNVDFPAEDGQAGELWNRIASENQFRQLVNRALTGCMVVGDGAFKLSFDPEISPEGLPILEWWDGDRVEFVLKRGRLRELIFRSAYPRGYTLLERYGFGYVHYELLRGDTPVGLDTLEATAGLTDVAFDSGLMMAVPMLIKHSDRCESRGQSFFDGKTDAFDALDECFSQWVHAMRASRPKEYIPTSMIPRNDRGELMRPNAFDNQFIRTEAPMTEGAEPKIVLDQAAFYADQYNATYVTALDLALQGLISPSTLGIDTKKLDNAEAQREKEKTTLYTRQMVITAMTDTLTRLVDTCLRAYAVQHGQAPGHTDISVSWGEYANPSFEAVVETLSNPNTPMSIRAKVDELWGDTKDDDWKAAEVERIRQEQGMEALDEPEVADGANRVPGFLPGGDS